MQSQIDDDGANTHVRFVSGSFTLDGSLSFYDRSVVDFSGCDIGVDHSGGSVTGDLFKNEDQTNGNDSIALLAYGADIDGNRSDMSSDEDLHGVRFRGDDGGTDNTDNFCHDISVLGGRWHHFRPRGVDLTRVIGGTISVREADNNGEPGDTATAGDGISVAVCMGVTARCEYAHDNERHGGTLRGAGKKRNVDCELHIPSAENNGNDGLNVESCENYRVTGTSVNDGMDGVHLKGTGTSDVTVKSPGSGALVAVKDYTSSTSDITGFTGGREASTDIRVESTSSGDDGITFNGDSNTKATASVEARDIGRDAILNNEVGKLVVESFVVDGCDRRIIFLGNDSSTSVTVQGGRASDWDRGDNGIPALSSGNNFSDEAVITGVSLGSAGGSNSPSAVNIQAGDYHSAVGNAFRGNPVTVNGSNSVTTGNS